MNRRTTIVTGAGSGIGRACAERLAGVEDHVIVWDTDAVGAQTTVSRISEAGGSADWARIDIGRVDEVARTVSSLEAETGSITGLVHAAAVMRTVPFAEIDEGEWDRLMEVNLRGTFFLVKAIVAAMERGGAVVLFSSCAGRKGRPLAAHYAASKAATISLTQSAAMAFGPEIRVNAVCPGVIETPMMERIAAERHRELGTDPGDPYPGLADSLPMRRLGRPDDVARVVEFLLGPLSAYVTGQALNVDGGLEFN